MRKTFRRREFLRIIGVSGVAGLAALKFGLDRGDHVDTVTETRLLMGTVVNLTLVTSDRQAARQAINACLDHMTALETILNRYRADSQLTRLNRDGNLEPASSHLVFLLREAVRLSSLTGGAFDVTVKPVADLYEASRESGGELPGPEAVAMALARVGFHYLDVRDDAVSFAQPGMAITLDGIAKGYIVDEGVTVLKQYGFNDILVEAGGDLSASGTRSPDSPWRIGVQPPRTDSGALLATFNIHNQAAATSGDYMQAYTDDFRVHHILDPRTGYPAPELASATVVAPTGLLADALATAMMVMGPEKGLALVETMPQCETYLVAKDLSVWRSSGFVST